MTDIDISDFTPDESEKNELQFVDLLNVYLAYYKKIFNKGSYMTMFEFIDYEDNSSTNKCMEFLYEEILKYNSSVDPEKEIIYEPSDLKLENTTEAYLLKIKNESKFISKYLLTLLKYLSELNYTEFEWDIVCLK